MKNQSKPIAVIINDIHYNLKNLDVADAATQDAVNKADDLNVPLIIAGDLHDTKANMRGECVQRMIKTLSKCKNLIILAGNHDLINEKGKDHSLEFLRPYADVIDYPDFLTIRQAGEKGVVVQLIPYQADKEDFKAALSTNKNRIVICHQGLENSESGEYFKDASAIPQEWTKDHIFISGHYHKRQTIGNWTFTGSPYTMSFGEANDPEKGFHVLYSDDSLEFVPTNLRRHIVIKLRAYDGSILANEQDIPLMFSPISYKESDLLWFKIAGKKENLNKWTKQTLAKALNIIVPFKLDLIPDKVETKITTKSISQSEVLDSLIESATGIEKETKKRLKNLWKSYAN